LTKYCILLITTLLSSLATGEERPGSVEQKLQELSHRITTLHTKTRAAGAQLNPSFDSGTAFEQGNFSEAKAAYDAGQFAYAAHILEQIRLLNPAADSASANETLWLLGNAYHQLRQRDKAVFYLTQYFTTLQQTGTKTAGHEKALEILEAYAGIAGEVDPKAIEALLLLLEESAPDSNIRMRTLTLLAGVYRTRHKDAHTGLKYADRAIEQGVAGDLMASAYLERARSKDGAEKDLDACIKEAKVPQVKDVCLFEAARFQLKKGKKERALSYYKEVSQESALHQQAQFERIYVYFDLGRSKDAEQDIDAYLAKYPSDYRTADIRFVQIYLAISTGQLDVAENRIQKSRSDLEALKTNLQNLRTAILPLGKRLDSYLSLHGYDLSRTDDFTRFRALLDVLQDQKQRAFRFKGTLTASLLAMENELLYGVMPGVGHKQDVLQKLADEAVKTGRELLEIQKNLYLSRLSDDDKRRWEYLEQKDAKLSAAARKETNRNKNARGLAQVFRQRAKLHGGYESLKALQAQMAAALYKAKKENNADLEQALKIKISRSTSLEASFAKGVVVLQGRKIERYVDFSKTQYVLAWLRDSREIHEEKMKIMEPYANKLNRPTDKALVEAVENNWIAWSALVGTMEKAAITYDEDLREFYLGYLERMGEWFKKTESNLQKTEQIITQIDRRSVFTLSEAIADDFDKLRDREELLRKWSIDLQLLTTLDKQDQESSRIARSALEAEVMSQTIRDLEKGIF
jgi:hypothetical protein